MSYSYVTYTGDGTTQDYIVPFPYLKISDVKVSLDEVGTEPPRLLMAHIRHHTLRHGPAQRGVYPHPTHHGQGDARRGLPRRLHAHRGRP